MRMRKRFTIISTVDGMVKKFVKRLFTSINLFITSCRDFHRKGEPTIQTTVKLITPSTSLHVAITAVRDFSLVLCSQPSFRSRHRPQISAPSSSISTHKLRNAQRALLLNSIQIFPVETNVFMLSKNFSISTEYIRRESNNFISIYINGLFWIKKVLYTMIFCYIHLFHSSFFFTYRRGLWYLNEPDILQKRARKILLEPHHTIYQDNIWETSLDEDCHRTKLFVFSLSALTPSSNFSIDFLI